MNKDFVLLSRDKSVVTLTMNRPKSLNVLEPGMQEALGEVLDEISNDNSIKAVILTGEGKAFSAGGDIKTMISRNFSATEGRQFLKDTLSKWFVKLVYLDKPVIAAVNGYAYGAAFNMVLACDYVVATNKARFSQIFLNVGLVPDLGGMYFLPRLVGMLKEKELIYLKKELDAKEAHALGFINEIVDKEYLRSRAEDMATTFAELPRDAFQITKSLLLKGQNLSFEDFLELEAFAQGICLATDDHKEGINAFLQKRKPTFK